MRLRSLLALALLVDIGGIASAVGQSLPGDPAAGRVFAIRNCSSCHVVAERQAAPSVVDAPRFAALARDPAVTELSLRAFFQTPHAEMPDIMLTRQQTDDVISYIFSLRR
ncbi:MAG: c-type cytochrome [Proteobacteria bacterium]|nr:c-type cytochrome [Pseudomonadota bacterium]